MGTNTFIYLLPRALEDIVSTAMILGITGGLGCGKSAAGHEFERRGFRRLDSDELVRDRVLTDPAVLTALRDHFGPGVFTLEGAIDRVALAGVVFVNDAERIWLEKLTHPLVFDLWRSALAADPGTDWALEVPLLFEQFLENWFDFTLCVACSYGQQLIRLEQRGLNRTLAGQRISKQLPLARKIELADFVVWNEGSARFLQAQVDRLVDSIKPSSARIKLTPATL
jgi:dephospho-CoA kinase